MHDINDSINYNNRWITSLPIFAQIEFSIINSFIIHRWIIYFFLSRCISTQYFLFAIILITNRSSPDPFGHSHFENDIAVSYAIASASICCHFHVFTRINHDALRFLYEDKLFFSIGKNPPITIHLIYSGLRFLFQFCIKRDIIRRYMSLICNL